MSVAGNNLHKLGDLAMIPDGGSARLAFVGDTHGHGLCALRRGSQLTAYLNRCPHTGGPLDWLQGQFLAAEPGYIQCATHGALFRVEDGYCVDGPCVGASLVPVPLQVDASGAVLLEETHAVVETVKVV